MSIRERLSFFRPEVLYEALRFGIVGVCATCIQYIVYVACLTQVPPNPALTIGYVVSFVFNLLLNSRYTFKAGLTLTRVLGFLGSHVCNYFLQLLFLNLFLGTGITKAYAMLPTLMICVPVNFILVRFVFKRL